MNRTQVAVFLISALVALSGCAPNTPQTGRSSRREQILNSTPEERARQQTQQLKPELALTAGQETAIAAINLRYARQMQPLIDNGPRTRETMQQLRQIHAAKEQELRRVLNPQQIREYEAQQAERRGRMQKRRGN